MKYFPIHNMRGVRKKGQLLKFAADADGMSLPIPELATSGIVTQVHELRQQAFVVCGNPGIDFDGQKSTNDWKPKVIRKCNPNRS